MPSAGEAVDRALRYLRRPDVRADPARLVARRVWYDAARRVAGPRVRRERVVPFDGDLRIRVDVADEVGRAIFKFGVYEHFTASVFTSLLRPGAVVVDGGANIGQYALLAAKRVAPGGRVLAFEPDPGTFARLGANLALNPGLAAELIPCALAARAGTAPLFRSPQEHNAGLSSLRRPAAHPSLAVREGGPADAGAAADAVTVRCVRLDDVLRERGCRSLDVVKLDVEGFELEALEGGAEAIEAHRPAIVLEVNDVRREDGGFTAPVIDWLRERGYRLYGCRPVAAGGWRLAELAPGDDPRRYKEHWQMRPELREDPFPEISPNLVALHP